MEWDPTQLFNHDAHPTQNPLALLLLNVPVNEYAYDRLAKISSFTVCADGATNRFYEMMLKRGLADVVLPDVIIGDLDSITPEVRHHYASHAVEIIELRDEHSTDFTKALRLLSSRANTIASRAATSPEPPKVGQQHPTSPSPLPSPSPPPPLDIVILGSTGGRMDQGLAQLRMLHLATLATPDSAIYQTGRVYHVSEWNISFVLVAGRHAIYTVPKASISSSSSSAVHQRRGSAIFDPRSLRAYLSESVGLCPMAGPATLSTKGLEWDLTGCRSEFLGQMSTSNHVRAEVVQVETDAPVLFTVELAEGLRPERW